MGSRDSSIICFHCGGYFHFASECRKRSSVAAAPVSREADDLSSAVCFACSGTGHLSYDCPNPPSENSTRGGRGRGRGGRGRGRGGQGRGRGRGGQGRGGRGRGGRGRGSDHGVSRDNSSKTCFVCEETGHLSYSCPKATETKM